MRVLHIQPCERLAPFVRQFTVVEADEETTRVLVPDGAITVGFRYGGSASLLENGTATRLPGASFAGLRDTARRMRTSAGGGVLLAAFREGGAAPFFAPPMHELFGAHLPLEALAPRAEVERTADRVWNAKDLRARLTAFEDFLLARLGAERRDETVRAAVHAIHAAPASIRIRALAAQLGLSRDRLEKRFRAAVGTSPKHLASLVRLRRAVESYRSGVSLTRLSADAGYFDQSHFIRAFRSVIGEPPERFFQSRDHC